MIGPGPGSVPMAVCFQFINTGNFLWMQKKSFFFFMVMV